MKAMLLERQNHPLTYAEIPIPQPDEHQVLLRVLACGVCRTDLHILDGDLSSPQLPLILGHEIVGVVVQTGVAVNSLSIGERVGVPWLGWTCGSCHYCLTGRENLCDQARFTGYQIDGGFAEYTLADARYCLRIDEHFPDINVAPLLCAGLIGYRALKLAGHGAHLGIYGFGAAAHLIIQVAIHQGRSVYAFTRKNDFQAQDFARTWGAVWAGDSGQNVPAELDAALIFAPVGDLVPAALRASSKGAVVVCAGIHMTDIPAFAYQLLWGERSIKSVANLTRADGLEFLEIAAEIPVQTHPVVYPLSKANEALSDLRAGRFSGAAVLVPALG